MGIDIFEKEIANLEERVLCLRGRKASGIYLTLPIVPLENCLLSFTTIKQAPNPKGSVKLYWHLTSNEPASCLWLTLSKLCIVVPKRVARLIHP